MCRIEPGRCSTDRCNFFDVEWTLYTDMDGEIICELRQYCRLLRDKEGTSLEFHKHRVDVLDDSLDAGNNNPPPIGRKPIEGSIQTVTVLHNLDPLLQQPFGYTSHYHPPHGEVWAYTTPFEQTSLSVHDIA